MIVKPFKKTICLMLGVLLVCYEATGSATLESRSLEQQLAAYIQYPPMLGKTSASVISVSFCIDNKGLITQVQPHSGIQALNHYLVHCLQGKKLRLPGLKQTQAYLVRLRFRPDTRQ